MGRARIGTNKGFDTLGVYSLGFLDAAVGLFERADHDRGFVDYAFYPAAYCLRHGVELFIKQMSCFAAYEHRNEELLYEPVHPLKKFWDKLRHPVEWGPMSHLNEWSGGDDMCPHLQEMDRVIEKLDELDPRGTLLRYPEFVSRNGRREDTHVPFDVTDFGEWHRRASAVLCSAQLLLAAASDRADAARYPNDPEPFQKLARKLSKKQE